MARMNWDKNNKSVRMRERGHERVDDPSTSFGSGAQTSTRLNQKAQKLVAVERRGVTSKKKTRVTAGTEPRGALGAGAAKASKRVVQRIRNAEVKKKLRSKVHAKRNAQELRRIRDPASQAEDAARKEYRTRSRTSVTVVIRKGGREIVVRRGVGLQPILPPGDNDLR
jgi:hypothetical protein